MRLPAFLCLVAFILCAATAAVAAPNLSVDFNQNTALANQPGFSSFAALPADATAQVRNFGDFTVTTSGQTGYFFRGGVSNAGDFTLASLYNDFIYHNTGGTISFSIDGVTPNVPYEVTWYSFDNEDTINGTGIQATNRIVPTLDTTGPTGTITYDATVDPVVNTDYTFTGLYTSTSSVLDFNVEFVSDNQPNFNVVRINGFQLTQTPEPASIGLWVMLSLVALGCGLWRRRG